MTGVFYATYIILWFFVATDTLLLLLLYRQYGRAVLPAKARMQLAGLDIGVAIPSIAVSSEPGGPLHPIPPLRSGGHGERVRVILFASSTCPVCERLWGEIGVVTAQYPDIDFWWVGAGERLDNPPGGWTVGLSSDGAAHAAMDVPALPYAYAVDGDNRVRSKGLMSDLSDFHQLIARAAHTIHAESGAPELLHIAMRAGRADL